jgi:hypothetical protein
MIFVMLPAMTTADCGAANVGESRAERHLTARQRVGAERAQLPLV